MEAKYSLALQQALHWIRSTYQVVGIIVSGSIVRGNPNPGSDFDIFVIQQDTFRQRVQKLFNAVPCEIFINTLAQTYQYFESELKSNRPVSATIIATGQVVEGGHNPAIIALQVAAKSYAARSPDLTPAQLQFRQYGLATLLEDAADVIDSDRATALYILDKVAVEAIEFIFLAGQQPLPRIKERLSCLSALNPAAGRLLTQYYGEVPAAEKLALIQELLFLVAGKTAFFEWTSTPEPCSPASKS